MIERLAVDTNAVIAWLRTGIANPPPLRGAHTILVPLPVIGELYTGAYSSRMRDENLLAVRDVLARHSVTRPDEETARIYGELRARLRLQDIRQAKINDVWIAALCIQHDLPLLTNDRGFDTFAELTVIHW